MYCSQCGRELSDDAEFCTWCGAPTDMTARLSGVTGSGADDDMTVRMEPVEVPEADDQTAPLPRVAARLERLGWGPGGATIALEKVPCVLRNVLSGESVDLDEFPFVIGRGQDVNYTVDDSTVSMAHVEIDRLQGFFLVTDLHSKNGTSVNGQRINPGEGEIAVPGSVITLGEQELRIERATASSRARQQVLPDLEQATPDEERLYAILNMEFPEFGPLVAAAEGGETLTDVILDSYDADTSADKSDFRALCAALVRFADSFD